MKLQHLFFSLLLLLSFSGCGGSDDDNRNADTTLFDLYWSSYSEGAGSTTTTGNGLYGAKNDTLTVVSKIISLDNNLSIVATDKDGNLFWSADDANTSLTTQSIYRTNEFGNNMQEINTGFTKINGLSVDNTNQRVYFSDNKGGSSEIGYVDFNGSNKTIINTTPTSGGPLFIDAQNNSIYVSDTAGSAIYRLDMNGNDLGFSGTAIAPMQLAIDYGSSSNYPSGKVIWTDTGDDIIKFANFDGTSQTSSPLDFSSTDSNVSSLVVDAENSRIIYAIGGTNLETADLNGNNRASAVTGLAANITSLWFIP